MTQIPIQKTSEKGQPNGYAALDGSGNVLDGAGDAVVSGVDLSGEGVLDFGLTGGDATAGTTIGWSDDNYSLEIKGRAGNGDTGIFIVNPDDPEQSLAIYCRAAGFVLAFHNAVGNTEFNVNADGNLEITVGQSFEALAGGGLVLAAPDASRHKVVVANDGTVSSVPYP